MAIQYYMRGFNTAAPGAIGYLEWVVNDTPDTTAAFVPSPFISGNIANITVNKVVQSKTENWLQPDQGYITADGKFFHLNSFDQLHASIASVTVIPVPTGLVGMAVTRGGTTNAAGQLLPGASTNFFSTLLWDEAAGRWKFIQNTNGDHVTQGAYQAVNMGDLIINGFINTDGYIAIGNNPALSGALRLTNGQWIESRRATAADGYLIRLDTTDRVQIGTLGESPVVYIPGNLRVDGYIRDGGTPALSGFVRNSNNTSIEVARDSTNANDHILTSTNNTAVDTNTGATLLNNMVVGNANTTFGNVVYNTFTSRAHQFQTNSATLLEIGTVGTTSNDANNFIRFSAGTSLPTIYQFHATSGSGQRLNVQAQSTTAASQTGGIVSLTSGSAPASGFGGSIELYTGNSGAFPVAATLKMRINPTTAPTALDNNSIQFFENLIRIDSNQSVPRYRQDDVNITSTPGQTFTIQAQNATGATSPGGNLNLTSGTGTTVAGDVFIQTGGVNRVQVTPVQTAIFGNLLVGGTVTSIASTVVELADRVIHVNSSANTPIGTDVPVPALITGISVARGQVGGIRRDYNGLFWHEVDGYWKFSVNTDGYTTETSLSTNLPVVAQYMHMQPSATITVNAVPTTGSYRALNNVVHSAARTAAGTQDLILVSTDATDHLIWGASANNAGHIFRTTTGTIYDFRVADVSTYTLTPQSAGTTTLQATSGVTALVYSHQTTGAASGATTSLQAQTAATNGGNLVLSSGQGSVDANDGYVTIETGNNDRIVVRNAFTEFRDGTGTGSEALRITYVSTGTTQITYASTVTAAQFNQTTTGGATGAPMTFQAQNAATTGGAIFITSGTGATAGDVNIQTGAVSRVIVHPTFTEFRDTAEAYRITPVSAGTTTLQAASTVTAVSYRQADLAGATGANTTMQAQNATTTGGNLIHTSGTGVTAGDVQLQTGGVDKVIVHPTFTEFRDTAEAVRITPVSAGTTAVTFASTVTAVSVSQTTTGAATGAATTVQAQNAATTGGSLNLTSGTGGTTNGAVNLQVGGVTTASLVTNKFVLNLGKRRHVTGVTTTYPVVATDDFIAITTLAAPFTITLPATPTVGDEYQIKDTTGNAGASNVTVDGNGNNIDGIATFLLSQPYASATFTFAGGQWSVS